MRYYEVDEAMLGSESIGGHYGLIEFVELLNKELRREGSDIEAEAHTDSCNGADNEAGMDQDTESAWSRALEKSPGTWWS